MRHSDRRDSDRKDIERRAYNEQVLAWFINKYRESFHAEENLKRKVLVAKLHRLTS